MRALNQTNANPRPHPDSAIEHLLHPRPCGVDERPRPYCLAATASRIFDGHYPAGSIAHRSDSARAQANYRSTVRGIAGVEDHQPGIVDRAIGILEAAG